MSQPLASAAVQPPAASAGGLSASEQLTAVALNGFLNLVDIIPGVVGRGLIGALKGALTYGLLGAMIGIGGALIVRWRWDVPLWMVTVNAIVATVAFGAAGAYGSGLQAALSRFADEMDRRGLVCALYAMIRPALLKAAAAASTTVVPLSQHELVKSVRASVADRLSRAEDALPEPSLQPTLTERVIRFLARRVQTQLAFGVIAQLAIAGGPGEVASHLEQSGISQLESALRDFIVDLFALQTKVAIALAFVVSVLPVLIYVMAV